MDGAASGMAKLHLGSNTVRADLVGIIPTLGDDDSSGVTTCAMTTHEESVSPRVGISQAQINVSVTRGQKGKKWWLDFKFPSSHK
jgi:hypothetical protein